MRQPLELCAGFVQLVRLGFISRFRFQGPYWTWRTHTAFGRGWPATRRERFAAIVEYAIWAHRMRRMR